MHIVQLFCYIKKRQYSETKASSNKMFRFLLPYLSISRSGKRDTSSNVIKVNNSKYTLSPPRLKFCKEPLSLQKVFEEDFFVIYYRSLQKIGLVVRWEKKHFVRWPDKNKKYLWKLILKILYL